MIPTRTPSTPIPAAAAMIRLLTLSFPPTERSASSARCAEETASDTNCSRYWSVSDLETNGAD
jgi:hypothetical protein